MAARHVRSLGLLLSPLLLLACRQVDDVGALATASFALAPPASARSTLPEVVAGRDAGAAPTAGIPVAASRTARVGTGGGAASNQMVTGQVMAEAGGVDSPLAGARVSTSDGRTTTTGADGRFTLAGGAPADGLYLASHAGYASSMVSNLTDTSLTLHLQARSVEVPAPASAPEGPVTVKGTLVDDQGNPLAGVWLELADARAGAANPVLTQADGTFSCTFDTPGQSLVDGTLLAADPRGGWLGMVDNLQGTGPVVTLAPVQLVAAARTLVLNVDDSALTLPMSSGQKTLSWRLQNVHWNVPIQSSVDLVAPDGTSLGLFDEGGRYRVAAIAGAHYDLHVDAEDASLGLESHVYRDDLAIDDSSATTTVAAQLLGPPNFSATPTLQPNSRIAWDAVAGAQGYRLTLSGEQAQGFLWEGYTGGLSLPWLDATPVPGAYSLTLSAWDASGLSPRTVASLPARSLRVFPPASAYRVSSRRITLTP